MVISNFQYKIWQGNYLEKVCEEEWLHLQEELTKQIPSDLKIDSKEYTSWIHDHIVSIAEEMGSGENGYDLFNEHAREQNSASPSKRIAYAYEYEHEHESNQSIGGLPTKLIYLTMTLLAVNIFIVLLEASDEYSSRLLKYLLNLFIVYMVAFQKKFFVRNNVPQINQMAHLPIRKNRFDHHSRSSAFEQVKGRCGSDLRNPCNATMKEVEVGQTENHSWSVCDATTFKCRIGPQYSRNHLKDNSASALFNLIGVDTFSTEKKVYHIAQNLALPTTSRGIGSTGNVPHLMVINVMVPWYAPTLLTSNLDGKGFNLVFYAEMSDDTYSQLNGDKPITPAVKLLQTFVNDKSMTDRLKMIGTLKNGEDVDSFPSVVKRMVTSYNSKPILISKPYHKYHHMKEQYYEMDVDVHNWSFAATNVFYTMQDSVKDLELDVGFVFQGIQDDELPETILCAASLNHIDNAQVPINNNISLKLQIKFIS